MNPAADLSIAHLITQASALVQIIMGLLTLLSLTSWYWIFRKSFQLRAARSFADRFERDFWSGG
ncbi:MAG: protein TolQ, partial [Rhodocyclaceae bacterium]|nr:protein TolQ [Rhodocyclaceae bacterium]